MQRDAVGLVPVLAAGVLVLIYFLATDRSRIARTGLVFEEPAIEAELRHEAESRETETRPR